MVQQQLEITPWDELTIVFSEVKLNIDVSSYFKTIDERDAWIHEMIDTFPLVKLVGKNENERIDINVEPSTAVGHTIVQMLLCDNLPLKDDVGAQDPILRKIAKVWYDALLIRASSSLYNCNDTSIVLSFFKENVNEAREKVLPLFLGYRVYRVFAHAFRLVGR